MKCCILVIRYAALMIKQWLMERATAEAVTLPPNGTNLPHPMYGETKRIAPRSGMDVLFSE